MSVPRAVVVPALAFALFAGCTDATPTPTPTGTSSPTPSVSPSASPSPVGTDVAIVGPPQGRSPWPDQQLDDAFTRARAAHADQVGTIRRVTLDAPVFRRDVLTVLVDESVSLACALGSQAASDVIAVARTQPAAHLCVVGQRVDEEVPNVLAAWFRTEELDYVTGVAAAALLPPAPPEAEAQVPPPTVGFVTVALDAPHERERVAFAAGVRSIRPDAVVAVETLAAAADQADLETATAAAVTNLAEEGSAPVVHLTSDVPPAPALSAALDRGVVVTGTGYAFARTVPDELAPAVLLAGYERLERALIVLVERHLAGEAGGNVPLGFADDALTLVPGGSPAYERVRAQVDQARDAITAGQVEVPPPG